MTLQARLHMVVSPLTKPFTNATSTTNSRTSILVELTDGVETGWGEAAPYPGHTLDTIDEAWTALTHGAWLRGGTVDPDQLDAQTARAAAAGAMLALEAARTAVSLAGFLGAEATSVAAGAAIGLEGDEEATLRSVSSAVDAGFRACKLKVIPGHERIVASVASHFPDLTIGVDANGSYRHDDRGLAELDDMGLAFIEQPLPPEHDDATSRLRDRMATPVALDESIMSVRAVHRALERRTADVVTLKPGRLGLRHTVGAIERAKAIGVGVRVSGLVESAVGQAHNLAAAALDGVTVFGDLTPAPWHLSSDVAVWSLHDGRIEVPQGAGLGVAVDLSAVDVVKTAIIE